MRELAAGVKISIGLGVLSLVALVVGHLALTDIRHGEADVSLEWSALRVCAAVIVAFQVSALVTLGRVLRRIGGGRRDRGTGRATA